jgi:DNA-binding transcriptional MerR regulator
MITIRGFAKLCGCNTQTLRFYDRIGLLIPAKVDEWTGYRYYEEEQAVQFVKIKNLQRADFSIEEIKALLGADDERLMEAFERKIQEQHRKIELIREIKKTYLEETMEMQNLINTFTGFIEKQADRPALWAELGLDAAGETEISARVHEQMTDWVTEIRNSADDIARQMDDRNRAVMKEVMDKLLADDVEDNQNELILSLSGADGEPLEEIPVDAEKVFSRDGWTHVSEWIDELPPMKTDGRKYFVFTVRDDSPVLDFGFPTLLLAVMDASFGAMKGGMDCWISRSEDGINRFTLLQK